VAGAYEFKQEGDFLFQTRVIKGITTNPRHDVWGRTGGQIFFKSSRIQTYGTMSGAEQVGRFSLNHQGYHYKPQARRLGQNRWADFI
jgi:hypothetical protein